MGRRHGVPKRPFARHSARRIEEEPWISTAESSSSAPTPTSSITPQSSTSGSIIGWQPQCREVWDIPRELAEISFHDRNVLHVMMFRANTQPPRSWDLIASLLWDVYTDEKIAMMWEVLVDAHWHRKLPSNQGWEPEEDQRLIDLHYHPERYSEDEIGDLMGRTDVDISARLKQFGFPTRCEENCDLADIYMKEKAAGEEEDSGRNKGRTSGY